MAYTIPITKDNERIYTPDVDARIETLKAYLREVMNPFHTVTEEEAEYAKELKFLEGLKQTYIDDFDDLEGWNSGIVLINGDADEINETIAKEFMENNHSIDEHDTVYNYINWDDLGESLLDDYSEFDYDGTTYYVED